MPRSFAFLGTVIFLLTPALYAQVRWLNVAAPAYGANGFDDKSDDEAFAKALKESSIRRNAGAGKHVSVTLYIPRGRYRFERGLAFPKWLNVVGDGPTGVLLDFSRLKPGSIAIRWGGPVDGTFPGEAVSVSGLSLLGPDSSVRQSSGTIGIHVGSLGDREDCKLSLARLSNVQITHFDRALRLGGMNYMNRFEQLYLRENRVGLEKPNVKGEKDNGENITFEFCVFGDNGQHFLVNPAGGGGYDLRFTGCSFDYAHATPEAEIGSTGLAVFDGCHWESGQAGEKDSALLIRISYPLAQLMFMNTEFKIAAGPYAGTPIQWASGAPSDGMSLTFMNCNFDGMGKPAIYGADPRFAATQPAALAIASPRLTAAPGKMVDMRALLDRAGHETRSAPARFDSLETRDTAKGSFACLDGSGRLFRKSTPCN